MVSLFIFPFQFYFHPLELLIALLFTEVKKFYPIEYPLKCKVIQMLLSYVTIFPKIFAIYFSMTNDFYYYFPLVILIAFITQTIYCKILFKKVQNPFTFETLASLIDPGFLKQDPNDHDSQIESMLSIFNCMKFHIRLNSNLPHAIALNMIHGLILIFFSVNIPIIIFFWFDEFLVLFAAQVFFC